MHPATESQLSVVHTFESLQVSGTPGAQTPAWQVSAPLHTVESAQGVPLAAAGFWHAPALQTSLVHGSPSAQSAFTTHDWQPPPIGVLMQPETGSHESAVHALLSLQLSGVPVAHAPAWQVSFPLHTVASAHGTPLSTGVCAHPKVGSQESEVQTFESLQLSVVPEVQVPAWQLSAPLQTLPSRHDVPFNTGVLEQPLTGSQESAVQTFESLQLRALPDVQVPPWHDSAPLQTLASGHGVPLVTGVVAHPKSGSQESVVQTFESLQLRALPEVQVPAWQLSAPLQTLPSRHGVPFKTGVLEHPDAGLHASAVQTLESLQLRAVPAVQVPLWHVSEPLQTLPSVQDEPFGSGVATQPLTGLQESVVQTFPSLQLRAVPGVQVPLWQTSSPLHTVLSAHELPLATGVVKQPMIGSQESVVQTLLSLQLGGVPEVHTPDWQVSPPLQTSPSAHDAPLASVGLLQTPPVHTSLVHGLPSAQSASTTQESQPPIGVFWQPESAWQESVVQALPSLQLRGVPAEQTPA
jgi:hypothetical protein